MSANLYIWAGAVLKYCARDLKTQAVHFLPARLALEVLPRNAIDKSTYLLTYSSYAQGEYGTVHLCTWRSLRTLHCAYLCTAAVKNTALHIPAHVGC